MFVRLVVVLAAALCTAPLAFAAAQQALDSERPAALTRVPSDSSRSTPSGPRLSPGFQRADLNLAPTSRSAYSAAGGGSHTIVISTLALVLGVIVLVLLITN